MSNGTAHHAHGDHEHHPTGLRRWLFSTNHKDIGTLYLIFAVCAGLIGGAFSVMIRAQLAHPHGMVFGGDNQFYNVVTTAHGLLMIFFKGFLIIMALLVLSVGNVIYQKFIAHTAILGWTSLVIIGLVNLAIICIGFFVLGLLLIHLNNQNSNSKEPIYEICAGKPVTETL